MIFVAHFDDARHGARPLSFPVQVATPASSTSEAPVGSWRIGLSADLASAQAAADRGELEAWVHTYLKGPGKNPAFAEGLAREQRYWRGPLRIELEKLERTCGPEPEMPYCEPADRWEARIVALQAEYRGVEHHAPLLVQYESGRLRIRDGNHRYAALESLHMGECWIILWYANAEEYGHHQARGFRV